MNCRGLWFFSIKVFWGRSAHGGVALSSKPARRSSLSSELANAISSQGAEPLFLLTSQREARLWARSLRLPGKILSASCPPAHPLRISPPLKTQASSPRLAPSLSLAPPLEFSPSLKKQEKISNMPADSHDKVK